MCLASVHRHGASASPSLVLRAPRAGLRGPRHLVATLLCALSWARTTGHFVLCYLYNDTVWC